MTGEQQMRGKRTKKSEPQETKHPDWQKTFVECNLDKAAKEATKTYIADTDRLWGVFEQFLLDGYAVKLSYDARSDAIGAYSTHSDPKHPSYPYCLTARAPDVMSAIGVLLYKHYVMLDASWQNHAQREFTPDQWA